MRIGELAKRSTVSRTTIRFYERHGLIRSEAGDSHTNNYRDYSEDNVHRLSFISGAREAGMSLAEIRDLMDAVAGSCDAETRRGVLVAHIDELRRRRAQIEKVETFLASFLSDPDTSA